MTLPLLLAAALVPLASADTPSDWLSVGVAVVGVALTIHALWPIDKSGSPSYHSSTSETATTAVADDRDPEAGRPVSMEPPQGV